MLNTQRHTVYLDQEQQTRYRGYIAECEQFIADSLKRIDKLIEAYQIIKLVRPSLAGEYLECIHHEFEAINLNRQALAGYSKAIKERIPS